MEKGSLKLNIDFVRGKQKTIFGKERIVEQGSIFRSENDIYSPPPLLKIIFFPPLATCRFSTPIVAFFP